MAGEKLRIAVLGEHDYKGQILVSLVLVMSLIVVG